MTNRTQPGDAQESWSSGEDYGETWHRKAKNRDVPTKAKFQTVRFTWQQHQTTNTSLSTQEHLTHLAPVSCPIGLKYTVSITVWYFQARQKGKEQDGDTEELVRQSGQMLVAEHNCDEADQRDRQKTQSVTSSCMT